MKATARVWTAVIAAGALGASMLGAAFAAEPDYPPVGEPGWGSTGWLSRLYGSFEWRSGSDPRGVLETVQPLHQSWDREHTVFFQGRASFGDNVLFNLGGGYRWLMPDHDWILGFNAFYDRQLDPDHARWGAGVEAIGRFATFRANYYDPTTGWITTFSSPTILTMERALEGFDAELETPLPFAPWASFGAGYYHWDVTTPGASDIDGFRGTLRMDLTQQARLEAGIEADNAETAAFLNFRFTFGPAEHVETTAFDHFQGMPYDHRGRDLSRYTLVRVERHNEIVVERRTVSRATGAVIGGVVIGRGR